jgi:2-polyprenyl-3-methyl-5-hydroxy-6-metoxy-1,4-benzoquinol methylase
MKPETIGHANARPCNLCGSTAQRQKYVIKDYRIVECEQCGFIFLSSFPAHPLADIYQEGYFRGEFGNDHMVNVTGWDYFDSDHYAEVRLRSQQTLEHLERFMSPGKILDIGCGPGIFLSGAVSRGWTAYGLDLSSFAVKYANENLRLNEVKKMDVEDMDYPDNSFDAVTMFHVIEHVSDPKKLVQTCNRIIKPNGIFAVETPDISTRRAKKAGADWKYLKIPEHVNYFSLKTLSKLLTDAGFKPLGIKRATESTGLMIKFCGGKEKARLFYDRWFQKKWFRFTTAQIRKIKETISGKILRDFDNITIVAKKA